MNKSDSDAIGHLLTNNLLHYRSDLAIRPEDDADIAAHRARAGIEGVRHHAAFGWDAAQCEALAAGQWQAQRHHYRALGGRHWTIDAADRACVGHLCLATADAVWRVIDIGIDADRRGRGIGSAMMRALRDVAVERGAMAIALSVAMDNSRAAALYRRCGYVEVPGDDPVAPYRAMRLSLA